jgi:hypothetical protein
MLLRYIFKNRIETSYAGLLHAVINFKCFQFVLFVPHSTVQSDITSQLKAQQGSSRMRSVAPLRARRPRELRSETQAQGNVITRQPYTTRLILKFF